MGGTERIPPSPSQHWTPPIADSSQTSAASSAATTIDRELTLGDLIDLALRDNPSTRRSWLLARQASSGLSLAQAGYLPQVGLGLNLGRSYQKTDGVLNVAGNSITQMQAVQDNRLSVNPSVNLTWLLWNFGARESGIDSARAMLTAANYQHNRVLQDVVRQVQTAYFAHDEARAALAATEATLELDASMLRATEMQRRSGLAGIADELRTRQAAAAAELQREQARQTLAQARSTLLQLAGLPPGDQIRIAQQVPGTEPAPTLAAVDSLVNQALATRPDIAARFAQVEALEAQVRQLQRGLLPSVTLTASANRSRVNQGVRTGSGSSNPDAVTQSAVDHYTQAGVLESAQAGVGINFDVTGLFVGREAIAAKKAELETTRSDLRTALNAARHDVWLSVDACRSAQSRLALARDLLSLSERTFDAVEKANKSGLQSKTELLGSGEQLARARSDLVQARARLFTAASDLAYATGQTGP